jgi:hypothetical protein
MTPLTTFVNEFSVGKPAAAAKSGTDLGSVVAQNLPN